MSTDEVEISSSTGAANSVPAGRFGRFRHKAKSNASTHLVYRVGVGVVGTVVLALGIVAIPYPGPGFLIVFAGLGILATEFTWAKRVLHVAKGYYDTWAAWFKAQPMLVKGVFAVLTFAIVVGTLWLLGTLGLVAGWFDVDAQWLQSPFV